MCVCVYVCAACACCRVAPQVIAWGALRRGSAGDKLEPARSVLRTSLAHASSPAAGGAFVTDAVIDCALHLVGLAAAAADADAASGPGGGEAWARLGTLCNVRAPPSRTAPPHSALPPSTPRGA